LYFSSKNLIFYRIVNMEIYGNHDIPMGRFLEEYCFRQAYKCPSKNCATPMLRHIRRFVHDGGCVQVKSKKFQSGLHFENQTPR
jgi:1-phosphatidylinositol-3-phosphate 5-kinase